MKKAMRLVAMLLACAMVFTACSSAPASSEVTEGESTVTETTEKVLRLTHPDIIETLNPQTTATNYELLLDMNASLFREIYDPAQGATVFVPRLAAEVPTPHDDTNKVWTIKVAEGYTFVDGTPIDAHTVEYSMKMLNDPKLANRNSNASDMMNGAAYLAGECEWSEVGFKAVDDYTIELTYADDYEPETALDVMSYLGWVGACIVHPEMYESCLSEDGTSCTYGSSLETFVASALYYPSDLIQGQYLELTRRTDEGGQMQADIFTPDKVEYQCVTDANTQVQMFEQGLIDAVVANQAQYDEYPGARIQLRADNMGFYINGESPSNDILKDVNMRYALYWGIDREAIVKAVYPTSIASAYQYLTVATMPDPADPANAKIHYRSTPEAQAIRIDGHEVTQAGYNKELALDYFEKAYAANGGQPVQVTAIYSDSSDAYKEFAEVLQSQIQELFGADRFAIELQACPSATIYTEISREVMNFDLCFSCGWYNSADYPWNNTNWVYSGPWTYNTQYCYIQSEAARQEWDELFYRSALYEDKRDPQKKLENCARMEEILLNDACFIPVYNRGYRWFFSDRIDPLLTEGDIDLEFCLMQAKFN